MDNDSEVNLNDDGKPDIAMDNNQRNSNGGIFGISFNNANFSTLSNDVESTLPSPNLTFTNIFSDVSSSINNSPVSAQTSIFSSDLNSNLTSPNIAQSSIFGNVQSNNLANPASAQVSASSNVPIGTTTNSHSVQPISSTPEVDLNRQETEPDPDPDADSDVDPDIDPDDDSEMEVDSNVSSRSSSSSPEAPDFNAEAALAPETLSLPSETRFSPFPRSTMPRNFQEFSIMFNSTKRVAAIKGQAQRIGKAGADQDDSGTYDPSLKRKRDTRAIRVKKNKENGGVDGTSKTRVGTRSERKTKEQGSFELIITIKLTSEKGLKYLKDITPGPKDDGRIFPPIHEADDEHSASGDEDDEVDYSTYSTRRKKIKTSHNLRSDGLTLEDLSNGHPQRRGCIACFESGNDDCSLIEFSHKWPCESCDDAGVDCELIVPPELKLSCIRCKEKLRKRCSYADDGGKGVDACQACQQAGVKCIAGPKAGLSNSLRMTDVLANLSTKTKGGMKTVKGGMKTKGESIKKAPATSTVTTVTKRKAVPRKYVPCNRCREEFKSKCSLKREDEGPCNRCLKAKVPCTFTYPPTPPVLPNKGKENGKGTAKDTRPVFRTPQDLTQTIILESTKLNDRVWRTKNPHARRTKVQQKAFQRAQSSSSLDVQFLATNPSRPTNHTNKAMTRTKHTPAYNHNYPMEHSDSIPPNFIMHHNGIRTITITTAFCHPIIFNYIRDPMARYPPCDFDTNPFFGLFGFGHRLVTVVPWPTITGAGYEELENGWGESGEEATRMCVKCTYERVKILGCPEHDLKPLRGEDPRINDHEMMVRSVEACRQGLYEGRWGRGGGGKPEEGSLAELVWKAKWCAVCPSPGTWVCEWFEHEQDQARCEQGRSQSNSSHGSQQGRKGCGLILCDTCYDLHSKIQKGGRKGGRAVLGRVVQLAGDGSRKVDYPDGVRADAGFLREDGELFIRTQKGGCAGTKGEVDVGRKGGKGDSRELGGGFDGVASREMSEERQRKGKGIDRFAPPRRAPPGENNSSTRTWKGKGIDAPQTRQILDSVTVSRGEVVSSSVARIIKSTGKGKGNGYKSKEIVSDEDGDSEEGVVKKEMMDGVEGTVGNKAIKGTETFSGASTGVFDGEFTGDGVISGRWKGKGVDRRIHGEMREDGVMRSTEREVIELSD